MAELSAEVSGPKRQGSHQMLQMALDAPKQSGIL
jgi:hypothetical protein